MADSLNKVQADNDSYAKSLTSADMEAAGQPPPDPPPSARGMRAPSPRVVRLSPDGVEQNEASGEVASAVNGDDPEDTAPRPSIKIQGVPGMRTKRGVVISGGQQVEANIPDDPSYAPPAGGPSIQAGGSRPSALDPAAKQAYDAALALVNGKQYGAALDAFASFLVKWPDHPNADNATYWRGECYFAQGEYAKAVEQYEGVVTRFPLGNKVPDALLKLSMSYDKLGNSQKAQQAMERLQHDFPRSDAATRKTTKKRDGDAPAPRREVNK